MTRRRAVAVALVGAAAALSALALWAPPRPLFAVLERLFPGCLYRVETPARVVALTVDDGPDQTTTPLLLDQLRRHHARATFFLIAGRVPGRERTVRRIVAEGHEIGNHFMADRPAILLEREAFAADLRRADSILQPFARPRWARPGSGWYSGTMVSTLREAGYHCALGSVYPFDTTIPSVAFARRYILRNVRPGAVIVLHDGKARGRRTARVLAKVLPELRRRGYDVVSLTELAAIGQRET